MSKYPWKTIFAVSAVAAVSTYAFAQMRPDGPMGTHGRMPESGMMEQMHRQMMQGPGGMHGGMAGQDAMSHPQAAVANVPTLSGQDAFGAIQEIVKILESDPKTDWSKVNIEGLRQHLVDMNEVTLHAVASQRDLDNGIEITVTGEGRTLDAIKRMLPAHVAELRELGWSATSVELPNGIKLTIIASETHSLIKLKALGFMGIMVQGTHHQPHHLMMAQGHFVH
jgi:hypothetical protein